MKKATATAVKKQESVAQAIVNESLAQDFTDLEVGDVVVLTPTSEKQTSFSDLELKVFRMHKKAMLPTKGSEKASCYDVYAGFQGKQEIKQIGEDNVEIPTFAKEALINIYPKARALIPTGIKLDIPKGYEVFVYSRSGLSLKYGLMLTNSVGVIDEDYRGELFISVTNMSNRTVSIENGERIAQLQLRKRLDFGVSEIFEYDEQTTERKAGGFGSTGSK